MEKPATGSTKTALCLSVIAIMASVIVCGNSNDLSNVSENTAAKNLSPLIDGKPHTLHEIFPALASPVSSIQTLDVNNDSQNDILLTTIDNKLLAFLKQSDNDSEKHGLYLPTCLPIYSRG